MSKSHIKWYTKQCDVAFSELIREKGRCEKCHSFSNLQCAHVIPRTNHTLRWDIFNALCLCFKCHIFWSHKDPLAFTDWFVSTFPARAVYLEENRPKLVKRTESDLRELLIKIQSKDLAGLIVFPH